MSNTNEVPKNPLTLDSALTKSTSSFHSGLFSRFAQRSQRAFIIAATARCTTPFSGPSCNNSKVHDMYCHDPGIAIINPGAYCIEYQSLEVRFYSGLPTFHFAVLIMLHLWETERPSLLAHNCTVAHTFMHITLYIHPSYFYKKYLDIELCLSAAERGNNVLDCVHLSVCLSIRYHSHAYTV